MGQACQRPATLTLDARLPLPEPYFIPAAPVSAIRRTRAEGGRVVALGTTLTQALEHAAAHHGELRPGPGLATQQLGPQSRLAVVDTIISGVHEPATSHHALRASVDEKHLAQIDAALDRHGYRTHEFGDSVMLERTGLASENQSSTLCGLVAGAR